MKKTLKYIAVTLSVILTLNLFSPIAYAASGKQRLENTNILYQKRALDNGVTYHKFENIYDNVDADVYEYYENDIQILDIYEGDVHDIIKIYPNGKMEINGTTVISPTFTTAPSTELAPRATGQWYYVYNETPLGGTVAGYNDSVTTTTHNVPSATESFIASTAITSLCTWFFRVIFPSANVSITVAVTILNYAMTKIKTIADLGAGNISYMSYSQTKATNNDVNTTLAQYYKYDFDFYAGPNCTSPISIDRDTTVYEMKYFN